MKDFWLKVKRKAEARFSNWVDTNSVPLHQASRNPEPLSLTNVDNQYLASLR